ncbi:MAG: TrkA family potassium uptake protein [Eubacterium sp.]|nr:TrkA family potassium uptake protein [Eubacterium sp.]
MKKNVLLVGGRSKAKSLALSLIQKGYKVTVVNEDSSDCRRLADLDKFPVFEGDGSKPFVLEDAGAKDADIAIALTSKDEDNLVVCELCKKKFNVPKTVALLSDPLKTDFFHMVGIDSVVCAISAVTSIIEQQAFIEEMAKVIPLVEGRVQILEIPITSGDFAAGRQVCEMNLPDEAVIACILRGDKSLIARGGTRILAGDKLVLISAGSQGEAAINELKGGSIE